LPLAPSTLAETELAVRLGTPPRCPGGPTWAIDAPEMPRKKTRRKGSGLTAKKADIHQLYQRSVQDPPTDIAFVDRVFKKERGRKPLLLREDFCGTALICADWVRKLPERRAIGIDLHGPTLKWGWRHNIAPLGEAAERVQLLQQNVLDPLPSKVDVAMAFNFSYCVFKTRPEMVKYCEKVRASLKKEGAFFLDIHGGSENTVEVEEETDHDDFTYVWDQMPYDAVNGTSLRYIHFRFPDGTALNKAFTYDWRLWTLPELREILVDAGFQRVDVYWEGATREGDGNGIFRRVRGAEQEESWIAYVVAWK